MVLYPNKLPESERVCFGICTTSVIGFLRIWLCINNLFRTKLFALASRILGLKGFEM